MLLATKGQQFTAAELARVLTEVEFGRLTLTPRCHGYFSVMAAVKP
jgi:hypothetical protein